MTLLDCHNLDTATTSLSAAVGTDSAALKRRLRDYDEGRLEDHSEDPAVRMPREILDSFRASPDGLDLAGVCCFHGTRVLDTGAFRRRGIMSLAQMLDEIWLTLFGLVHDECSPDRWARFRREVEDEDACDDDGGFQYRSKTAEPDPGVFGGPDALFVRECLLRPNDEGLHDYLQCPEIVQDIARCFQSLHGIDLESRFREASVPCIVKFRIAEVSSAAVENALWYAFTMLKEGTLANACGGPDLGGRPVPPEDVLDVELIAEE